MTGTARGRTKPPPAEDDQLNEQFHTLLRDAAEKREGRTLVHSTEDAVAAKQESADLLILSRGPAPASANLTPGHRRSPQSDLPAKGQG